jgi:hypothetical protein
VTTTPIFVVFVRFGPRIGHCEDQVGNQADRGDRNQSPGQPRLGPRCWTLFWHTSPALMIGRTDRRLERSFRKFGARHAEGARRGKVEAVEQRLAGEGS